MGDAGSVDAGNQGTKTPSVVDMVRRLATKVLAVVGATGLIGILWLLLGWPLGVDRWLDVTESPDQADAIVCIGGGTYSDNLPSDPGWRRIYTAVQLFADGYAPVVVFTGRGTTSLSEAETYADAAVWLGIPREATILDPLPASTADHPMSLLKAASGRFTRQSRLLLVTSGEHSRRLLLTFRKQGFSRLRVVSGYTAVGATNPLARHAQVSTFPHFEPSRKTYDDPFNRLKWRSADLLNALREVTAIAWYWTRGLV